MPLGRTGRILFIDLTTKTFQTEKNDPSKMLLGGRGTNQWLIFESLNYNINPLDPRSLVVLGAGPFVGTLVPGANRLAVDFKNVITKGVGSGNCGGHFPAEMKFAGYDHILITGKSKKPVYIFIFNEKVYFRDASELWGKKTWETENTGRCSPGPARAMNRYFAV